MCVFLIIFNKRLFRLFRYIYVVCEIVHYMIDSGSNACIMRRDFVTFFICLTAKYMVSCEEAKMLNPLLSSIKMYIDIDDSGPLDPFEVNCVFNGIWPIILFSLI